MPTGIAAGKLASYGLASWVTLTGTLLILSGCVSNQAKVSMLQAPEVVEASKYKNISVARFGGQLGDTVSNDLEAALLNAKVQDKPVYRSVVRAPESRSLGSDYRSMASAARSLGTEAIFVGEVTQANINDARKQHEEFVCNQKENPNKFFSKCLSGYNKTVYCTERTVNMEVQVKLVDAQSGTQIYAEAIVRNASDSACGGSSPKDGRAMLGNLRKEIIDQIKSKVVPHERVMNVGLMDATEGIRAEAARTRFEGAVKFGKENRMDRACDMFREIYDSERKSVSLAYNLGVCEEGAGAFWKAEEYYRLADQMTNEPNKLITAALSRNAANLKKAGSLAQNRADLIGTATIESGAAPQTIKAKGTSSNHAMESATKMVPQVPQDITPEVLMLEKRTALVVGNAAYKRGALSNPVNDARAIASVLRALNFKVIQVENASFTKMGLAVEEFGRAIKEGGVALVFYAGHGMHG